MKCNLNNIYSEAEVTNLLCRVQWLMIYSYYETLGISEERILKVLEKFEENVNEYKAFKKDGVADDILNDTLKTAFPRIFKDINYKGV